MSTDLRVKVNPTPFIFLTQRGLKKKIMEYPYPIE